MKWRKVMAFSLAASMIAGQAVSAAPAAEAASESALQTQADSKSNTNASYTDPWTKTAVPNQAAKVTSDVDKTKFTHKEWMEKPIPMWMAIRSKQQMYMASTQNRQALLQRPMWCMTA